jgi:uroporphyrinogen-III synthase
MLFSPRSAKIFADLVTRAGLAPNCARVDAYCISAATAAALGGLTFARVAVAGQPNQDAMLALAGDATG